MADTAEVKHDYHLVDPSPWPLIGSISAFVMMVGLVLTMKSLPVAGLKIGPYVFGSGLLGVLYVMAAWWSDVIREAGPEHRHTRVVQLHHRYGMMMFIASEVMFFVAWFWAFFEAALYTADPIQASRVAFTGGVWPPKGIEAFDPWHLPLLNTLILLTSGTTITWAHHALLENDRKGLKYGLWITVVLGLLFTACQGYEYAHAAFGFVDLLHGDGLSRRARRHRHRVPRDLPVPRLRRTVHHAAASRVRVRRVVLALRRRGLAVPVRGDLRLGFGHRPRRALRP